MLNFQLSRKDICSHEENSHAEHTRLLYQNLTNSNNRINNLNQANVPMKQEIMILKVENVLLKQENVDMKQEIVVLKVENVEMKREIADKKKLEEVDILKNEIADLKQLV